jgi:putative aminopeptidase FrvX
MLSPSDTDRALKLALTLTDIPTAAGKEQRIIAYVESLVAATPGLMLDRDTAGNLVLSLDSAKPTDHPLFITGHLDHPAFVVERMVAPGTWELSFRGGVMEVFFDQAPITLHTTSGPVHATLTGKCESGTPAGDHYLAQLDRAAPGLPKQEPQVGDIGTWRLPPAEIDSQGILHTLGCDDLAAVAAALAVMVMLAEQKTTHDVRLLLTRAEEIGFVGAIAACKLKTMPAGSRVVALENSRSFADSPIGGGPIVRVGDRMSVFTPWLTSACAKAAERTFGSAATPRASQTNAEVKRPWQRKLMAGGACEASVFCHHGYDATCLCLPLGNYHNMPHLDALQAQTYDRVKLGPPRCAREFIHTNDYLGLIELLLALSADPPSPQQHAAPFEKLYNDKAYVLA